MAASATPPPALNRPLRNAAAWSAAWRAAALVAVLATPMLLGLWTWSRGVVLQSTAENRFLASLPSRPSTWAQWLRYPAQWERWVDDHMGLRQELIRLHNQWRALAFNELPSKQVILGSGGRAFLATHTGQAPYGAILAPCGVNFSLARQSELPRELAQFRHETQSAGLDAKLIIAPSPPMVYADRLPAWLRSRCEQARNPIPEALAHPSAQESAGNTLYPLEALRAIAGDDRVMPLTWFHWAGEGPRMTVRWSMERFWPRGQQAGAPMPTVWATRPSDMAFLVPGFSLPARVESVDFARAGVDACVGPDCFPEMLDIMRIIGEASLHRNPKAALGRLVMVSDSYGLNLAPWFARHFREVVHVNTNLMQRLNAEQTRSLRRFLFADRSSHLVFVYHDGTVLAGRIPSDFRQLFPAGAAR